MQTDDNYVKEFLWNVVANRLYDKSNVHFHSMNTNNLALCLKQSSFEEILIGYCTDWIGSFCLVTGNINDMNTVKYKNYDEYLGNTFDELCYIYCFYKKNLDFYILK